MQWGSALENQEPIINPSFAPVDNFGTQYHGEIPFQIVSDRFAESLKSYSDLSGDLLNELQRLRNSSLEEPHKIQDSEQRVPSLHEITSTFKALKTQHVCLQKDQAALEESIRSMCTYQRQVSEALHLFTNSIAATKALSTEEFAAFQKSSNEFRETLQAIIKKPHNSLTKELMAKANMSLSVSQNLTVYQSFLKVAATELFGNDIKPNTCAICYENSVSEVLVPCGHTFCSKCIEQTNGPTSSQYHKCMTCRTPYTNKVKIYL